MTRTSPAAYGIELLRGDITTDSEADAIVNAANQSLLGGGGVDGAIHRAAGPELLAECRTLGGCDTGDAKITGAGRLPVRHVIHARTGLAWWQCRRGCAAGAVLPTEHRAGRRCWVRVVAFPAISCGIYGYPVGQAAGVAIGAVAEAMAEYGVVERSRFWLFSDETYAAFDRALQGAVRRE